ncbi:putative small secreted protein [Sphingomonas vulcanisoli]|uniref:Small secreted protein n=1 Tax=Sphingomonas vulcanisoli TaxID=1658060 RepID=A0ABX0TR98_9SPHN|nr:hypothetical protein [Sphingomonas vulcanisoli]NIJ07259.1 putative small secreted protein [Sphingomonas vulcanisoli]
MKKIAFLLALSAALAGCSNPGAVSSASTSPASIADKAAKISRDADLAYDAANIIGEGLVITGVLDQAEWDELSTIAATARDDVKSAASAVEAGAKPQSELDQAQQALTAAISAIEIYQQR